MLLGSAALFALFDYLESWGYQNKELWLFMAHYLLALAYTWLLITQDHLFLISRQRPEGRSHRMILWVLWLISAFALNRSAHVFRESTPWLCVVLVISGCLIVSTIWLDRLPVRWQQVLVAGLAACWWLFLYQTFYLVEIYLYSIPGLLLLGISIHTFIPFLISVALGRLLIRSWREHEHRRLPIILGALLPVLAITWFVVQWQHHNRQIRYTLNEVQTRQDDELPNWFLLAQRLQPDWVMDRLLKTGIFYDDFNQLGWSSRISTEEHRHDPLVVIASFLSPSLKLSETESDRITGMLYDARHRQEERLRSGQNLRTANVVTQARIYPQYRLAYTEKTMQIQSQSRREQEALYTFHVPEGSVVTSLSLWINGREEKGILTTQAKADSAYRTVVGVEYRDPSVVRWQEGNRVTVRVFPCVADGERQMKVGITSPLRLKGDRLVYENTWFEGPNGQQATETAKIDFDRNPELLQQPSFLEGGPRDTQTRKSLASQGDYHPDWELSFKAPALDTSSFGLAGKAYRVVPSRQVMEFFDPAAVYLDLNAAWTTEEIQQALAIARKKPVFVYDEGLVQLTPANRRLLTERLTALRFSVFPIYLIPHPESALLITKGTAIGPQLDELKESPFATKLSQNADHRPALRTFNLEMASAWSRTLGELGVLQMDYGTIQELTAQLEQQRFIRSGAADGAVVLAQAGIRIEQAAATAPQSSAAPDHLFRLYAYHHLMTRIGRRYFRRDYLADSLLTEAQQANVVSPLSSLIVLETQADYARFSIKKGNGLDNATLKKTGAVPEPHEWALLLLSAGLVGALSYRRYVRA